MSTRFQVHWEVLVMIRNYDENALLESSGLALLFNLILSVYTFDFMLP